MKARSALLSLVSLVTFGCLTPYAPGYEWGYKGSEVEPGILVVRFKANPRLALGMDSRTRVADFALLRCAELTLAREDLYFTVIETRDRTTGTPGFTTNAPGSVPGDAGYGSISGGSTIRGIEFRIRTSRTRPADEYLIVYDAAKLAQDMREKYELPASSESQI